MPDLHPQMFRAPLEKLGELSGERLDDPAERLRPEPADRALPDHG